ncbi:MAG: hypothetical protein Roseis2KO_39070 [Roseivirga sp.]
MNNSGLIINEMRKVSEVNKERLKLLFFVALAMLASGYESEIKSFEVSHGGIVYPLLFGLGVLRIVYKLVKNVRKGIFIRTTSDLPKQIFLVSLSTMLVVCAFNVEWNITLIFWLFLYTGILAFFEGFFYQKTILFREETGTLHLDYKHRAKHELTSLNSFELENNTLKLYAEDKTIEVYDVSMRKANVTKLSIFLKEFQKARLIESETSNDA